jgi:hypothetical protein
MPAKEATAQKIDLDMQQRLARENWLQERTGEAAKLDLEEVRRIARVPISCRAFTRFR